MARVIRTVRPEVLLGHDPWRRYRLHPDHRAAGFLTLDALVAARDPHFFPDLGLDPHRPDALLLWEADLPTTSSGVRRRSPAAKVDALLCHRSQLETTMGLDRDGRRRPDAVRRGRTSPPTDRAGSSPSTAPLAGLDAGEAFHLIDQL